MRTRLTIAFLLLSSASLLFVLFLRAPDPSAPLAAPAPSIETRAAEVADESAPEVPTRDVLPVEIPVDEPASVAAPASPLIEADPASEQRTPIRIHLVTPDGRPFERALDRTMSGASFWSPTVLVTAEPSVGPHLPPISPQVAYGLGKFSPRQGRRDLPASCIGEVELHTDSPVFLTLAIFREWLGCQPLLVLQEDVEFVLDPEEFRPDRSGVRMRLVDRASAVPIDAAQVSLGSGLAGTSFGTLTSSKRDGTATFTPWPAGPWQLEVAKQGYKRVERELVLQRGEMLDLGDLELEAATPVLVRVNGSFSRQEISVFCRNLAELRSNLPRSGIHSGPSLDLYGAYEVFLGEGDYVVWAARNKTPYMQSAHVIVSGDQVGTLIELELHELVPVTLHTNWIGAGRTIEVRDSLDIPVQHPYAHTKSPIQLRVVPGRYRVRLGRPDGAIEERTIEVGVTSLEIALD